MQHFWLVVYTCCCSFGIPFGSFVRLVTDICPTTRMSRALHCFISEAPSILSLCSQTLLLLGDAQHFSSSKLLYKCHIANQIYLVQSCFYNTRFSSKPSTPVSSYLPFRDALYIFIANILSAIPSLMAVISIVIFRQTSCMDAGRNKNSPTKQLP